LEHGIEFMRKGGTIDLSCNLSIRSGSPTGLDPDKAIKRILDAGQPLKQVTMSSDANCSMPTLNEKGEPVGLHRARPRILHQEWVQAIRTNNLKLEDALPLLTSNVARVLALESAKGSLQAGKDADLLLLNEDLSIDTVIARGRVHVRDGKAVIKGPWEEPL
jgi:beta-aspartyl-dipeptidase (metallo-type)